MLKLELPGTKLVIGDGPERGRLQSRYGTQALFVGYRHGLELVNWLSMCDVMVFPSRTDTFGLVILEALACGIKTALTACWARTCDKLRWPAFRSIAASARDGAALLVGGVGGGL